MLRVPLSALCLVILVLRPAVSAAAADDPRVAFFEEKIRPVLIQHCYSCHAADAKNVRGGLLLDSQTGVLTGGDSGPSVVPGKPDESLLLEALRHESFEMPPDQRLPEHVIADFERWVAEGAIDPRTGGTSIQRETVDLAVGRQFWSFRPVTRPAVPAAGDGWAITDIDRFVAAGYARQNLNPVADAEAVVVARRLYYGLTGLPPGPDQLNAFRDQWQRDPDQAIDALTEELLASPRFGERWGRHWLDVARFAESSGGGRSLMFPHAWRFRDYVIQSFNDDKPFDQLIREQIAGDLLPWQTAAQHDEQVTGVGYLTLGPTNYELQDKELLRMEVVDEQIDTIGRSFLGLTLGCARCHDHKFDPIPTTDYYALAGIFRSTKTLVPGNVSGYVTASLKTGFDQAAVDAWQTRNQQLKQQIAELKKRDDVVSQASQAAIDPESLPGIVVDDTAAKFTGEWIHSSHLAPYVGAGYHHDGNEKSAKGVRFEVRIPAAGRYQVRLAHNSASSRCAELPVRIEHADGTATVTIDQRQAAEPDGVFSSLGTFQFAADQTAVVSINAANSGGGYIIVDAVQFLPVSEARQLANATDSDAAANRKELQQQLTKLEQQLKQHGQQKPELPETMAVRDEDQPADWHLHVRGGIRNLGPLVPRGFVSVASPAADESGAAVPADIPDDESGRLQLADWIASPENPLTARVFVNRVWQHLLAEGLVRTPDNFGATGRTPTHPELLDYLADTFVQQDQWSVKSLIRRIVRSRVYRLSSSAEDNLKAADPENLWLARGFRGRLDAESLRDSILQVSGQLDLGITGGRTIARLATYDNGYDHARHSDTMRSVYVPFFRNSMLETFEVFDVANSNLVTGRRTVSTLPAQALYLLNSPFMLQQSEQAAQNFLSTQSADPAGLTTMTETVYLQVVGRRPTSSEQQVVAAYMSDQDVSSAGAWAAVYQALFASMDFRYLD